ncbi:MAG TPA: hypothetical protein VFO40_22270 [Chthoniobacterales bacterium]|nr:hypothetical protein [Chthoniobacterales bacterium]
MPTFAQEQNTVDPEVRQQIEAAVLKYQEAYNNYDATATAALFTQDAVEVVGSEMADAGSLASGREAIEGMQPTSHLVPANHRSSLFRCMQSVVR